ncbi:glycosyltransferase [Polaribacter sp. L3A8]|uniref:glycosyltransferase n=1 Tax=Polaribacter sp. L3A8 TaxID=2686361 RepID=UPI00131AD821|nr:glycosyltransferase [Polaribacter sp. L3A8]
MIKIKVLQIIDSLNVGGAEVLAVNIANSLTDVGYESHICVTRKEGDLKYQVNKNVGYLFLERKRIIDLKALKKLSLYVKKHKINRVHAHASSSFIGLCVKLLNPKIKLIWHDHYGNSEFLNERKIFALKLFSYFFSAIISVNKTLKFWAEKNLACSKVFFINNFVEFRNLSQKTKLNGVDEKRIVMLAGFRPQKDHLNLLNAFEKIVKEFPDWTLHLVGKLYQDNYSKEILNFVEQYQLKDSVFFYGVQSDIKYILQQSSIGVLSSKSEGLPLALLEYGLARLPVVVSNVGECGNVVTNGKSGIVVEKENSLELKNALEELINSDEKRKTFGELHYKNVINYYSPKSFLNQLVKIYTL